MDHHEADGREALTPAAPDAAPDDAAQALEAGRRLFAAPCTFLRGAAGPDDVADHRLPEVAFAGRSNVGKSSLVNALTGRRTLARISKTPGRTQQLNFFDLGGRLILVDLPGYGFAQAPKPLVTRWTALVNAYLKGRVALRRVCLLIDARHGAKPADLQMMDLLDAAAVPYLAVLTKVDKLRPGPRQRALVELRAALAERPAALPEPVLTSAADGLGIAELRAHLAALADPATSG